MPLSMYQTPRYMQLCSKSLRLRLDSIWVISYYVCNIDVEVLLLYGHAYKLLFVGEKKSAYYLRKINTYKFFVSLED